MGVASPPFPLRRRREEEDSFAGGASVFKRRTFMATVQELLQTIKKKVMVALKNPDSEVRYEAVFALRQSPMHQRALCPH
jgi:hypothetical protein